jgi:hypothetical protein
MAVFYICWRNIMKTQMSDTTREVLESVIQKGYFYPDVFSAIFHPQRPELWVGDNSIYWEEQVLVRFQLIPLTKLSELNEFIQGAWQYFDSCTFDIQELGAVLLLPELSERKVYIGNIFWTVLTKTWTPVLESSYAGAKLTVGHMCFMSWKSSPANAEAEKVAVEKWLEGLKTFAAEWQQRTP